MGLEAGGGGKSESSQYRANTRFRRCKTMQPPDFHTAPLLQEALCRDGITSQKRKIEEQPKWKMNQAITTKMYTILGIRMARY